MRTASPPAFLARVPSPLGRLEIGSDGTAITSLSIETAGRLPWEDVAETDAPVLAAARTQLAEYFAGSRTRFDLPLIAVGTPFQEEVWRALQEVPFGAVLSYGELGRITGRDTAGRAIGGAVGANPVPLIIPCHRVLASDGRITGYSAGDGILTKAWLLDHEGIPHR